MNVAFRVDASDRIGTGHVVRCLTLATALAAHGADIVFVCRDHRGNQAARIESAGFPVRMLAAPPRGTAAADDYAAWLGVPQRQDADETVSALAGAVADWIVVDHYGLDERWEREVGAHARNILAIDDLADRPHACDLLLDQNYGADAGRYEGLLPPACLPLLGPRYALLNGAYARQAPRVRRKVERILVYFGGVDAGDATGLALEALSAPDLSNLAVDVVVGARNPHRETIAAAAARRGNTVVHGSLPHMAELMAKADLAVGAAGTTTWERMCMGLPSVVLTVADNQLPAARALAADGLIFHVGEIGQVTPERLREEILARIDDVPRLCEVAGRGQALVDGHGAGRVADRIAAMAGGSGNEAP